MKKVGFIIKNVKRVNGKEYEYFYLRRSDRLRNQKKETNLYSFGNRQKALSLLNEWEQDIESLPETLKDWGYDVEDVKKWKEEVESK